MIDGQHHDESSILGIECRDTRQRKQPVDGVYVQVITTHHLRHVLVKQDHLLGIRLARHGEEGFTMIDTGQFLERGGNDGPVSR